MFQHSVKVPRQYKIAANIFKKVATEGGSVKTLLYDDKLRHFRTNVLYALITETVKHSADLDILFDKCNLIANEPRLDLWLAKVLSTELLFGKKSLPGKSKPELTILSYKEKFEHYISEHEDFGKVEVVPRPRYVRINTNLLTTSDAIQTFQEEGYNFIRCTSGSYNDYLNQIRGLTEYDFTQDYHVKTVFVFSAGTKFHDHEYYHENKIVLQDKATSLAVHLLAPPQGSVVLDMCAAPGLKTTQLAAYMRNKGKIYAIERNEKRYATLCDFVEKTGSKCVHTYLRDSLSITKGEFDDVEYILLDPSCSGSGMDYRLHNYVGEDRLEKLASLQEKFLKHAMNSFPKAKRIVYSTCSLLPEENERVLANVVRMSRSKWRVQECKDILKGQWNNFGSGMYGTIGTRGLYAKPDSDLTTGFFVAVLDRDIKELAKAYRQEEKEARDLKRETDKARKKATAVKEDNTKNSRDTEMLVAHKKNKRKSEHVNGDTEYVDVEEISKKKKKKYKDIETLEQIEAETLAEVSKAGRKKRKSDVFLDQNSHSSLNSVINNLEDLEVKDQVEIPKKKKKKDNSVVIDVFDTFDITDDNENVIKDKKKKKKKRERSEENSCRVDVIVK